MSYREAFIRQNFGYLTDRQMAEALGLTMNQVEYIRRRIGLRGPNAKEFTEDERATIIELYADGHTLNEIGKQLKTDPGRVSDFIAANIDTFPDDAKYRNQTLRGKVLCTAKEYAGQFGDPYEAFLMVMKRRQEVEGLLLSAANVSNNDNHPETNEVGRLLPYWQDLNAHAHRLAKML